MSKEKSVNVVNRDILLFIIVPFASFKKSAELVHSCF